jgi:ferric-dicitrate binding protein FerR (iron transport regulator)
MNDQELLHGLLDGTLSAEEHARLAERLRSDRAVRRAYRRLAALHVDLQWDYMSAAAGPEPAVRAARAEVRRVRWWSAVWAVAAAVTVLAGVAAVWWARAPRSLLAIEEVSGSVAWRAGAQVREGLAAGVRLAPGTIETVGEIAMVRVALPDGTRLTLGGNAELDFSGVPERRLHLRRGTLTAAVAPQPAARPLRVRTATAEIEVLGTLFAVSARGPVTQVNVESGRVRTRRLVDGSEVEVPALNEVRVSLDAGAPLRPRRATEAPVAWRLELERGLPAGWRGDWQPATDTQPARVRAVPIRMGRKGSQPLVRHAVASGPDPRSPFVQLTAESVLRLRWRTARPARVNVFLVTRTAAGTFGGNFELRLDAADAPPDADGWREMKVPLAQATPTPQTVVPTTSSRSIAKMIVSTPGADVGLEIAALEITPR